MAQAEIHIGSMIKGVVKRNGITVTQFAEMLPCARTYAFELFHKRYIDIGLLLRVCAVLRHDFFADISSTINADGIVSDPLTVSESPTPKTAI